MIEITLALIKPDAVQNRNAGLILHQMEQDFAVCDVICSIWSRALVAQFYAEHAGRSFFHDLLDFMTMDRIYAVTLVGPDAVKRWRTLMGATDPKKAEADTIRGMYGSKVMPLMYNAVHGSDSPARARAEIDIIRQATRRSLAVKFTTVEPFGDVALRVARAMIAAVPGEQDHPPNYLDEEERAVIEDETAFDDAINEGPVPESEYGAHLAHCCKVHGCKYSSTEGRCPVVTGKIEREFDSGWCQEPGVVADPATCRVEGERMPSMDYHE